MLLGGAVSASRGGLLECATAHRFTHSGPDNPLTKTCSLEIVLNFWCSATQAFVCQLPSVSHTGRCTIYGS